MTRHDQHRLRQHGVEGVDASLGLRFGTSADVLNAAADVAGVAIGKQQPLRSMTCERAD